MRNLGKTISGAFAALRRNVLETRRVIATALEGGWSTTIRRRVAGRLPVAERPRGRDYEAVLVADIDIASGAIHSRAESDKEARERSAVLEYRVEASAHRLGARLEALRRVGLTPRLCTTPLDLRTERRKPLQHLWWL